MVFVPLRPDAPADVPQTVPKIASPCGRNAKMLRPTMRMLIEGCLDELVDSHEAGEKVWEVIMEQRGRRKKVVLAMGLGGEQVFSSVSWGSPTVGKWHGRVPGVLL